MNLLYDAKTNIVHWDEVLKIPEFQALQETPQNVLWHKEGNAYIHTCMVTQRMLDYINKSENVRFLDLDYRKILVYAALLHDVGKAVTTKKDEKDGLYHCKDHAIKGVPIAEHVLNTYVFDVDDTFKKSILSLVRYHMQPLYILNKRDCKSAILKLANNLEYIDFETLLLLKQCDCEGSIMETPDNYQEVLKKVKELYFEVCSYPAGTRVYLEKLEDADTCDYEPGNHPNGINVGYIAVGYLCCPVTIGYRTYIGWDFSTSPVVKIIDRNHFQTMNSVYKITEF